MKADNNKFDQLYREACDLEALIAESRDKLLEKKAALGQEIKSLRRELGLTQRGVARILSSKGIAPTSIANVESPMYNRGHSLATVKDVYEAIKEAHHRLSQAPAAVTVEAQSKGQNET